MGAAVREPTVKQQSEPQITSFHVMLSYQWQWGVVILGLLEGLHTLDLESLRDVLGLPLDWAYKSMQMPRLLLSASILP
jgi:hypothetical protein